jgi:Arc/MetJ-type ribon-helix-helix transcriptional regulator
MPSRVVRARLDDDSAHGLAILMGEGRNESEAVRAALVEAADRRRRRSALAEEARRLAADEEDLAEVQAVLADMDALSPEWPE